MFCQRGGLSPEGPRGMRPGSRSSYRGVQATAAASNVLPTVDKSLAAAESYEVVRAAGHEPSPSGSQATSDRDMCQIWLMSNDLCNRHLGSDALVNECGLGPSSLRRCVPTLAKALAGVAQDDRQNLTPVKAATGVLRIAAPWTVGATRNACPREPSWLRGELPDLTGHRAGLRSGCRAQIFIPLQGDGLSTIPVGEHLTRSWHSRTIDSAVFMERGGSRRNRGESNVCSGERRGLSE